MRPYELFIGLRYTRAKRRNHFISFISIVSAAGIAIGVAALITVLSVMNGFQKEIRTRMLGAVAHVQITGYEGPLRNWQGVIREASAHPEVLAAAPYVNAQGLLANADRVQGVLIRGVIPAEEARVIDLGQQMKQGRLDDLRPGAFGIILGAGLAGALGVYVGEQVVVIAPQGQVTPAGILPRIKQFTVVGIFQVGHNEYDTSLALVHLADAQKLYRLDQGVSGVRLKLRELFEAPAVARDLAGTLSEPAFIGDWTQTNANWFKAVEIEKRMMFIILTLIVAVAAFNLVSTLVMAVTDKQPDIAILRTLGASPFSIMKIFIVQGALIGVVGTLLGVIGGLLLALNLETIVPVIERLFRVEFLDKGIYYISELPSDPRNADVITVGLVSLVLSLLATLYPSYRASRVNPAEALRYE